jgi:hypothetical protein
LIVVLAINVLRNTLHCGVGVGYAAGDETPALKVSKVYCCHFKRATISSSFQYTPSQLAPPELILILLHLPSSMFPCDFETVILHVILILYNVILHMLYVIIMLY